MLPELFKSQLDKINPTTLLTGMGVTGVVSTAYLTARASFKAARMIDVENQKIVDNPNDPRDLLDNKEKVKLVWPLYIPPIGVGCTTITAIVMANHTASKKVAALTVASGISERALQEYKTKVMQKLGEAKEQGIRDEIAQDRVNATPTTSQVIITNNGDVMCFDTLTGRYFSSNMEKLRQAMNNVNYELIVHDHASLSFFYDQIDLAPTPYSDMVGWRVDDHPDLQISTVMSPDNRPCIAIDFDIHPHASYSSVW